MEEKVIAHGLNKFVWFSRLSQTEVARRAGISRSTLIKRLNENWEAGRQLYAILEACGLSKEEVDSLTLGEIFNEPKAMVSK